MSASTACDGLKRRFLPTAKDVLSTFEQADQGPDAGADAGLATRAGSRANETRRSTRAKGLPHSAKVWNVLVLAATTATMKTFR